MREPYSFGSAQHCCEQAQKWLSYCLKRHGLPPLTRNNGQHHQKVLAVLNGIKKQPEWREHRPKDTEAFALEVVKRIFNADVVDQGPPRRLNLKALRNKALAVSMIVCGWHPIDGYRVKDCDVIDDYEFRDRTGEHRPKFIFCGVNVHHTKRKNIKVRNVVGCGCFKDHNDRDPNCFYNVVKSYMNEKRVCDDAFFNRGIKKLNKQQRAVHIDAEGQRRTIGFFRAMQRRGPERCARLGLCAPPREHGRQLGSRCFRMRLDSSKITKF